jgi:glycosyltransferase involved in cell wall biosynthesis
MDHIVICIPLFNDWSSATLLVDRLDDALRGMPQRYSLLLVDDGSTEPVPAELGRAREAIERVEVVHLRCNLGHQRAIAVGLAFVAARQPCRAVVVMDADGEDDPTHVPELVRRCEAQQYARLVFAQRSKRSEGFAFRAGYAAFRALHRLLTGRGVQEGNFSVVPFEIARRLVAVSELWNHYAAAVFKARLPTDGIWLARATRLSGKSKMDFVSLVTHGLSAISVFGEVVGTRILCFAGAVMIAALLGLAAVVAIRLWTDLAIPGWATNAAGLLGLVLLNMCLFMTMATLFVLQSRDKLSFLPARDYDSYVLEKVTLYERGA